MGDAVTIQTSAIKVGTTIDRYRLTEEIGEGGFGIVFLAVQTEPVRRQVALKVIKPGMDSKEVIARFEAERQALALMDHPNIARVHDAGATESGHPYFVMELVRGIPITRYCDERDLSPAARLRLFIDVSSAVQHAHQKGIIHRDLKPSNILVSDHGGQPMIKVIDFGIAKAINMELTDKTVFTELGRMIGTPQYMSPEQAYLNAIDVDTRSDIYSLGVILYELLTGATPIDPGKLRHADYAEIQSMIRHDQPVKPSACLTALGNKLPLVAKQRRTEQGKLQRLLRGDLDWIVMKALEKDRTRRYQTTNGLAVDIERYLNDEPVSASPPSATYRLAQFAKRHRTGVTWSGVIALIVMAAMVVISILGLHAIKAEKEARISEVGSLVQEANAKRWTKTPERRWDALDKLTSAFRKLSETFRLSRSAGDPPQDLSDEGKRLMRTLRDTAISCLAIADMRVDTEWRITPADGDGEMIAADHALGQYAHSFRDGRIALHELPDKSAHWDSERLPQPRVILENPVGPGTQVQGVLKFSPDGEVLAAGYAAGGADSYRVIMWRLDEGKSSAIDAGSMTDSAFAFFPDNEKCAIGRRKGENHFVDFVNRASGESIRPYPLQGGPHSISVSKDGSLLAISLPEDDLVVILEKEEEEEKYVKVVELDCDSPRALAWGTYDDSLAVCTGQFLALWRGDDWRSGRGDGPLELRRHDRGVEDSVAWSPDGRLLASHSRRDRSSRLWDPSQGGEALCWHRGTGSSLEFSADGSKLGIFRERDKLYLFEVASGDVCLRGRGHPKETDFGVGGIFDGVWNEEGTLLATSGSDGVRFWNREGRHLGHIKIDEAQGVAFSRDAFFAASGDGLHRWGLTTTKNAPGKAIFEKAERIGELTDCGQASISPDGDWLAVTARNFGADSRRALWLIDLRKPGFALHRYPESEGATTCSISADGHWLAAGLVDPSRVAVWEMPGILGGRIPQQPVMSAALPIQKAAAVAFSPLPYNLEERRPIDEPVKWLVTGDSEQYQFWKTGSWERKEELSIPSQMHPRGGRMAFSSRGTALALAVKQVELKVYALPDSGPVEFSSPDFDKEIPVCFSPYGRILITTKPTGQLFFWKLDEVRTQLDILHLDWPLESFDSDQSFELMTELVLPAGDE